MAYTPVEIRHVRLAKGPFGYRREAVNRLLEEIGDSFEHVWRDRADLADRVEQLEADLVRYKEGESLLRTTLISAEKAAAELKHQAKREADLIIGEAQVEARAVTRDAAEEREFLLSEIRRIRALLRSALEAVEETADEEEPDEAEEAEAPEFEAA